LIRLLIDEDFKPWMIEVNTNPCLETTCLVLENIIPKMLDSAFQLSVDLVFPPPIAWASSRKHLVPNHVQSGFKLIFNEKLKEAD
jgi:tubulin polyglutamylase TTLL1